MARKRTLSGPNCAVRSPKALKKSEARPTDKLGPFVYPRLEPGTNAFRLLRLLPGDFESLIDCKLYSSPLQSSIDKYTALSYTWGAPTPFRQIQVNSSLFTVRENLYDFLRICRKLRGNKATVMWIDAICIDQNDTRERNHQVALMGQIYSGAKQVYAFLGHGCVETEALFPLFNDLPLLKHHVAQGKVRDQLHAIRSILFERPYWSRIWIVQELLLAKKIMLICGERTVEWNQLQKVLRVFPWIRTNNLRMMEISHEAISAEMISQKNGQYQDLPHYIRYFGHLDCIEQQDHVYALVGLANKMRHARGLVLWEVDYSTPSGELLCQIVHNFLNQPVELGRRLYRSLDLAHAHRGTRLQAANGAMPPPQLASRMLLWLNYVRPYLFCRHPTSISELTHGSNVTPIDYGELYIGHTRTALKIVHDLDTICRSREFWCL